MGASERQDPYVAFLRAVNVGGRVVTMDRLRSLFEALGLRNVATFIASGNVLFDAAPEGEGPLETRIEAHLRESLGYEVSTFVRSLREVRDVAAYDPFAQGAGATGTTYVAFLRAKPSRAATEALLAQCTPNDRFRVHGREAYWHCRPSMSASAFSGARLEKTLGMPATLRNMTTVRRLAAKFPPPPRQSKRRRADAP